MVEDNKRLAILDELDQYNTAPSADSLMLGILQEEEGRFAERSEQPMPDGEQPIPEPPAEEAKPDSKLPNDYLPLNSSIQELRSQQQSQQQDWHNRLSRIEQALERQTQQRQQPQETYDPDMPVTAQHMQTLAQRQEMAYNMSVKAYKNNLSTRAHLEYQRFKSSNPDFNMDPAQLDFAIDAMARDGKIDQLENTNWRGHFEQMYAPQRENRYGEQSKELEQLRKEVETLKKTAARSTSAAPPVSPATGRSSRGPAAISTPLQKSNEDQILDLKSFRQKGNFKGFAKDVKPFMGIRQQGA